MADASGIAGGLYSSLTSLFGGLAGGMAQNRTLTAQLEAQEWNALCASDVQAAKLETLDKYGKLVDETECIKEQTDAASAIDTARLGMIADATRSWMENNPDQETLSEYPKGEPEVITD